MKPGFGVTIKSCEMEILLVVFLAFISYKVQNVAGAVECPTCAYFTESNSPNPKCLDLEEGHPYMTRCPDDHVCQTMFTFKTELNDNKFVGGFKGSVLRECRNKKYAVGATLTCPPRPSDNSTTECLHYCDTQSCSLSSKAVLERFNGDPLAPGPDDHLLYLLFLILLLPVAAGLFIYFKKDGMSVMSGKVATDDPDFNQIKSFSREGADSIEC